MPRFGDGLERLDIVLRRRACNEERVGGL